MNAKHTPGPWQVKPLLTPKEDDDPMAVYVIENIKPELDTRYFNAGESGSQEEFDRLEAIHAENRANARLIAAAPDLIEACEAFLDAVNAGTNITKGNSAYKMGRAAIAKALGE